MKPTNVHRALNRADAFLPGREDEMALNDAGGAGFIDDRKALERFVLLGIDNGTLYVDEQELSRRVIDTATRVPLGAFIDVVGNGRRKAWRPRNPVAALAIRAAFAKSDRPVVMRELFDLVIRTPSDLAYFTRMYHEVFGASFSRSVRRAVARRLGWFSVHQLAKYRKRWGVSMRDVLRLAHATPTDVTKAKVFQYLVRGIYDSALDDTPFGGIVRAANAQTIDDVVRIAREYDLSWEMVPNRFHKDPKFWAAFLHNDLLPPLALVRSLWRFLAREIDDDTISVLVGKVRDSYNVVHPGYLLTAQVELLRRAKTEFEKGRAQRIVRALSDAFGKAVGRGDKALRVGLAIDTSGSMMWSSNGVPLMIQALVVGSVVEGAFDTDVVYFSDDAYRVPVSVRSLFEEAIATRYAPYSQYLQTGSTNAAAALEALAWNNAKYDATVLVTDEMHWRGGSFPLTYKRLKDKLGKLIVLTVSGGTNVSLTDPKDPDQLTIVGMLPEVNDVVAQFVNG